MKEITIPQKFLRLNKKTNTELPVLNKMPNQSIQIISEILNFKKDIFEKREKRIIDNLFKTFETLNIINPENKKSRNLQGMKREFTNFEKNNKIIQNPNFSKYK